MAKKMNYIYLVIAVPCLLLSGCSGYMLQSQRETVFTESFPGSIFTVTFCGNAYMAQKEAEKYAMQRACELTLKKGCTHFLVLEKSDKSKLCMLEDAGRNTYASQTERSVPGSFVGPQSLERPNISLKIQCYGKRIPADAIDAQQYLDENFPGLKFKNPKQ